MIFDTYYMIYDDDTYVNASWALLKECCRATNEKWWWGAHPPAVRVIRERKSREITLGVSARQENGKEGGETTLGVSATMQ